jgi:carboxymethylenebutenolidase
MGKMITLNRPDGGSLEAYVSDINPTLPGVIVIQEWWGLNDQMKAIVNRLASEGFNALAPDLFRGRVVGYDDSTEAAHLMDGLDFPAAVHQDIAAAEAYMAAINPKVGVMGFCMGGALTIASAVRLKGFGAAVCFYGMPPREFADPADMTVPFQGHFGERDDWVSPAVVADVKARMEAAGRHPEIFSYPTDHAFFNTARPEVYDAASAELAWSRLIPFLKQHL